MAESKVSETTISRIASGISIFMNYALDLETISPNYQFTPIPQSGRRSTIGGGRVVLKVDEMGKWHIWICFIILMSKFSCDWHSIAMIFLMPRPTFECADPQYEKCSRLCLEHKFDRSVFKETVVTEWDLVCERSHLVEIAQSFVMMGTLLGGISFGLLADKFGRKYPLLWAIILQLVTGVGAALSPWYSVFVILRFLSTVGAGGSTITSYVLITELCDSKWRDVFSVIFHLPFFLGHVTLPAFSYFLRHWRHFQAAYSSYAVIFLSYHCLLTESPKWLTSIGEHIEAISILKGLSARNDMTAESLRTYFDLCTRQEMIRNDDIYFFKTVFGIQILRKYSICLLYLWFMTGFCMYGMTVYVGNLEGNIFINVTLVGLSQVPSTFIVLWAYKAFGRWYTLLLSQTFAGVACMLMSCIDSDCAWLRIMLACLIQFGIACIIPTVYIYAAELFPTIIRSSAVGFMSVSLKIGSIVAPFLVDYDLPTWIPTFVLGSVLLGGCFFTCFLPDTMGCLPDTLEEILEYEEDRLNVLHSVNPENILLGLHDL